jgi:protein-tyrosine phosphatase
MLQSAFGHNQPGWQSLWVTARRLRRMSTGGFRRLQFSSLLLTRSYWGLLLSMNWWDVIDEHFFLGGALMFDDLERLQGQGVQAVVNLCAERQDNHQRLREACIEYLWLPVVDTFPPTLEQVQQGVAWIEQQLHADRIIYIHCAAGVGRSATLLACWYLYTHGMRVPQVLRFIKARRPQIALTRRQIRCLHEFAAFLQQQPDALEYNWRSELPGWWTMLNECLHRYVVRPSLLR